MADFGVAQTTNTKINQPPPPHKQPPNRFSMIHPHLFTCSPLTWLIFHVRCQANIWCLLDLRTTSDNTTCSTFSDYKSSSWRLEYCFVRSLEVLQYFAPNREEMVILRQLQSRWYKIFKLVRTLGLHTAGLMSELLKVSFSVVMTSRIMRLLWRT